jgi:hypothetical protein
LRPGDAARRPADRADPDAFAPRSTTPQTDNRH